MAAVADDRHLATDLPSVVVEIHKVEFGRIVAQNSKEAIGERRVGLPRRDGEPLFFLALERGRLDRERRNAAGAILCRTGEGHLVFVVGNEADDLELVLRSRRVATAGRAGKRSDLGRVTGLFATGDLVGDGYGIRCRKANVAAQSIGAKGVLRDKRSGLAVAAGGVLGIEPLLDGRLLLDVVGRDDLLVELLLLVGELVARSRCVARTGPADRAAHEPCPGKCQRARRARKSRSTREQSAVLVTQFHIVAAFECHRRFPSYIRELARLYPNMAQSLTSTP